MVQSVTLPFGVLNALPGVAGVEDVTFNVPEFEDLTEATQPVLEDLDRIGTLVEDLPADVADEIAGVDEIADRLADTIQEELGDLDDLAIPTVDEIAEAVADEVAGLVSDALTVDIQGSLFSIEQDFVDLLAAALDQAGLEAVSEFPTLAEIDGLLDGLREEFQAVDIPNVEEVREAVENGVESVLRDLPGGTLLTDPDQFIDDQIDRVTDGLVDPEVEAEFEAVVDQLEEDLSGGDDGGPA